MGIWVVILLCLICFILGILFGKKIFTKKTSIDGTLYCGINKDGQTWMGLKAIDPTRVFLQDTATFKVELRDEYNAYSDKEEMTHGKRRHG